MADIVRTPNQILNVYFSQMIENGVVRGYGMNFYDGTAKEGWSPVGYVPSPFGFYRNPLLKYRVHSQPTIRSFRIVARNASARSSAKLDFAIGASRHWSRPASRSARERS